MSLLIDFLAFIFAVLFNDVFVNKDEIGVLVYARVRTRATRIVDDQGILAFLIFCDQYINLDI